MRKGKRLRFIDDHEKKLKRGCYISGCNLAQIKTLIGVKGIKIDGLLAWIEVPIEALEEDVLRGEGFYIAANNEKKFCEYTRCIPNLAGTKALIYTNWSSRNVYSIASDMNLRAYVAKFGIDNLHLSIREPSIASDYLICSCKQVDAMTWAELEAYLILHNLDGNYNLDKKIISKKKFKKDIRKGKYSIKTRTIN